MVTKRTGKRKMSEKPATVTMKRTVPRRARMMATRRAKTATEMVMTMKRPIAGPERAMWEARKDCIGVVLVGWIL